MEKVNWKPELWKPLSLEKIKLDTISHPPRVKSFFNYEPPSDVYEVRGILPKAEAESRVH